MKNIDNLPIIKEIFCEMSSEYKKDAGFDSTVLMNKIKDAYRKVKTKRCYQYTSYTEEQIEKDMYDNYYSHVKDVATYNYVKIGGEFQTSHSENGITRSWGSESDVLSGVISFVGILNII